MTYAMSLPRHGGPDLFEKIDFTAPVPGPGEVKIAHRAIGLNFIDTYMRSGLYSAELPGILGCEGAGEVVAVGQGVEDLKVGDRVAYCQGLGAYATERVHKAAQVVKLPDSVAYEAAAAIMLQGLTVRYLLKNSYPVQRGETVLWHAAAGGRGSYRLSMG